MPTYKDYQMLSDGISSLENSLLNKKKLRMAEQERQDRLSERSQDREDRRTEASDRERLHREVMAANEKERSENNAFRNKQADITAKHYKNVEDQNAASGKRLSAEQQARERKDKQAVLQATYQFLATKVEHDTMTPEAAYMAMRPAIDNADPEDLKGTMFAGLSPESFGGPAPAKVAAGRAGAGSSRLGGDMGTVEETTGPDGTKRTIRRPLTEQDLQGSQKEDPDSWESQLVEARGMLRRAVASGDKATVAKAQATVQRIEDAMAEESVVSDPSVKAAYKRGPDRKLIPIKRPGGAAPAPAPAAPAKSAPVVDQFQRDVQGPLKPVDELNAMGASNKVNPAQSQDPVTAAFWEIVAEKLGVPPAQVGSSVLAKKPRSAAASDPRVLEFYKTLPEETKQQILSEAIVRARQNPKASMPPALDLEFRK